MVLQEGCHRVRGVSNRGTCLKNRCPWLLPALSYFHHSLYSPAPTAGKTEKQRGQLWRAWGSSARVAGRSPLSRGVQLTCLRDATVLGTSVSSRATAYRDGHNHGTKQLPNSPSPPPRWSYFLLLPVSFCSVLRHFIPLSCPMWEQPCVHSNPVQPQG